VIWKKGKNHNDYIINGDSKENVNRGAPEDIVSLKVLPVEVTGSQKKQFWPQIAQQHDPVSFVLSEQGTTVAEVVVSDVEKVTHLNQALFLTEKQRREAKSKEKIRSKDLEKVKHEKEKYSPIRAISRDFSLYQDQMKITRQKIRRYEYLNQLNMSLERTEENLSKLSLLDDLEAPSFDELSSKEKSLRILEALQRGLISKNKEILSLRGISELSIPKITYGLDEIKELHDLFLCLRKRGEELSDLSSQSNDLQTQMRANEKKISLILIELGVCPTCGKDSDNA
jgi:hypothetical protein